MAAEIPAFVRATLPFLMVGGLMLSGCSEQPQWEDPRPSVSTSATPSPSPSASPSRAAAKNPAEACSALIADGAQIEPWECEPLPRIKEGDFHSVSSPLRNVTNCDFGMLAGYVSGPRQPRTDLTGLPSSHEQVITRTMQNPVTNQLAGYAEGGTYFSVTIDVKGLDALYTEVKPAKTSSTKQDVSEVCFGSESILPADLRATINHEGGHAVYSQLKELAEGTSDTASEIRTELANLSRLCEQEFNVVVETFRASQQQQAQAALTKLRAAFVAKNNTVYSKAVDELMQRFATQNGLNGLLISQNAEGEPELERRLFNLVDMVKARQGNPSKETLHDQLTFLEYIDWATLNTQFEDHIREQFGYMLEGIALQGATPKEAGHSDTVTGNMASGIATVQMHPKAVMELMNALPLEQRRLAVQKLGVMQRLIWLLDPKLAEQTHLASVAGAVNVAG